MRVCGIIAEYDPFHLGHLYQMQQARALSGADYIVCVMSCAFTQRGMPALLSAHQRADMALHAGADVVLGLPVAFSVCDAERFALGSVEIFRKTGVVDALSFGLEPGSEALLHDAAHLLEAPTPAFRQALREGLQSGCAFPQAQGEALSRCLHVDAALLAQPNTALAICYARANLRLNAHLSFYPVSRRGAYHDQTLPDSAAALPSATAVRAAVLRGEWNRVHSSVPDRSYQLLKQSVSDGHIHTPDALTPLLRWALRTGGDFSCLPTLSEGLENRLPLAASCATRDDMVHAIKSRRYPYARINRLLTHVLLHTDAGTLPDLPSYAYVLGFRKNASHLLRKAAKNDLALYGSLSGASLTPSMQLDARADDLWSLGAQMPFGGIYREKPVILP